MDSLAISTVPFLVGDIFPWSQKPRQLLRWELPGKTSVND